MPKDNFESELKETRAELYQAKLRIETLETAALKMIRAVDAIAFIIPNGGAGRDRAVAAWDGLKTAMGVTETDIASMGEQEKAHEAEQDQDGGE